MLCVESQSTSIPSASVMKFAGVTLCKLNQLDVFVFRQKKMNLRAAERHDDLLPCVVSRDVSVCVGD